jgi:hypothetical protein
MQRAAERTALLVLACLLPIAASCKATRFQVKLAPAYRGRVLITCDATGTTFSEVAVDANGSAEAGVCPANPTDLVITRDGVALKPDGAPTWQTTGDGIPVAIQFSVR